MLMTENAKIKDMKLFRDREDRYCLYLTLRKDYLGEVIETEIPQVVLPIKNTIVSMDTHSYEGEIITATIDLGFGDLKIIPQPDGIIFNTQVIETKKMTLDEIEKKLGHKVEIING